MASTIISHCSSDMSHWGAKAHCRLSFNCLTMTYFSETLCWSICHVSLKWKCEHISIHPIWYVSSGPCRTALWNVFVSLRWQKKRKVHFLAEHNRLIRKESQCKYLVVHSRHTNMQMFQSSERKIGDCNRTCSKKKPFVDTKMDLRTSGVAINNPLQVPTLQLQRDTACRLTFSFTGGKSINSSWLEQAV